MAVELSLLIIRILAVFSLTVGLAGIMDKKYYQKIAQDTFRNTGLTLAFAMITLTISLLIINYHNIWTGGWIVLITIIGWIGLLKGISFLLFPKVVEKFSLSIFQGSLGKIVPYTTTLIGLILMYVGFIL